MKRINSLGAKVAAIAAAGGLALTAFGPAAAATTATSSSAEARFLSGSGGGGAVDFDQIAALEGVSAKQSGDDKAQTEANPLKASLLGQQLANQADGLNLPLEQLIRLGAVNQYAQASPNGKARAASGAVADGGAINTTKSKRFPSDATLDLSQIAQLKSVTDNLIDLKLHVGAVSSVAAIDATKGHSLASTCAKLSDPKQCRDYSIAGANATLKIPALKTVLEQLKPLKDALNGKRTTNLESICRSLPAQTGPAEKLCEQLNSAGKQLITVKATPPDLNAIMDSLGTTTENGLTIDLENGVVTLDLEKLLQSLGLDLNNLPPNTDLVQYLAKALATTVPDALNETLTTLSKRITAELAKASVSVSVGGTALPPLSGEDAAAVFTPLIEQLSGAVAGLTKSLQDQIVPQLGQLKALKQLISMPVNVQDSPSKGVFRETALQIKLLNVALPTGSLKVPSAAPTSMLELNLARAQVGVASTTQPGTSTPIKHGTPTSNNGPDLPNTGAGLLDLPFLLLGLALVTGGAWVIMFGRAEHLES